jgi:hypothetical protein
MINYATLPGLGESRNRPHGRFSLLFRFRYLLKTGAQDWSTIVSVVVLD